jgi:hypothetical protein
MIVDVAILIVTVAFVGAFMALLMLPRWFFYASVHNRLWRLRDQVVDDCIFGRLPEHQAAVAQLRERMESAVRQRAPLGLIYIHYRINILPNRHQTHETAQSPSLTGLTVAEQELLMAYRRSFRTLFFEEMLMSSWFGIMHVLRFLPQSLWHQRHHLKTSFTTVIGGAITEARELAVAKTRLGATLIFFVDHGQAFTAYAADLQPA